MAIKVLFTAHASAIGGRNGHTRADDGLISVDLSIPKAMGGPGKPDTSTPEHLFAAGYAACFGSACEFMSRQLKIIPTAIRVNTAVGIGEAPEGGFGLSVAHDVEVHGVSQPDAEKIVAAGHQVCPYSRAIKGNVDVTIKVTAVPQVDRETP
ncbi:MAG: organic hydroperoxide resistance protein [Steroidobacteraceae bacterium]